MKIKRLRKNLKLNQEEFADALGMARQELSQVETGKKIPDWLERAIYLYKLLKENDKDFDWLLEEDDE